MILNGRLQWALAAGMVVFSLAAVASSFVDGDGETSVTSPSDATTTSVAQSTTTTSAPPTTYTVQMGESLFTIAQKYSLNMQEIIDLNGIEDPDKIAAGDILKLPAGSGFVAVIPNTTEP
jgi:LysM repeat protein